MGLRGSTEQLMFELIAELGTQAAVAKALNIKKSTFNYWLNYAKAVPFDSVLRMQALLAEVREKPAFAADIRKAAKLFETPVDTLPISERVKKAMVYETLVGDRQGQRTDLTQQQQAYPIVLASGMREQGLTGDAAHNLKETDRCTDNAAAQFAGFKSRNTYCRAKKVVQQGIPALVQAMDNQTLSIALAAKLAALPPEQQREWVGRSQSAINAYLQQRTQAGNQPKPVRQRLVSTAVLTDKRVCAAETKHRLPLRAGLIGLLACCDSKGRFTWQPDPLAHHVLPHTGVDSAQLLDALAQCGFVEKIDSEPIGQIQSAFLMMMQDTHP